LLTTR
jgi:obg-like ATPase 1